MFTDKVAITDWKAVAHKWTLNTKSENNKNEKEIDLKRDKQFVYESLLEGKAVSKAILVEIGNKVRNGGLKT